MNLTARIFVAGGDTFLGQAILRRLREQGYRNLVGVPPGEPDLTATGQVEDFFAEACPEYVVLVGGPSGGIRANRDRPADLMVQNLLASTNVLHAAFNHGVSRLLYLASSCVYPRNAPQPLTVDSLMTGVLEPTSEAYALARLAGLKLCQAYRRQYGENFIAAIPANPFGPGDDFHPETSHVIPGLIRRMHQAKICGEAEVVVWGTGAPRREFVYGPDVADACLFLMRHYDAPEPVNVGSGVVLSVAETAAAVAEAVGYRGRLRFDARQPDGVPFKALDSGPLKDLGWTAPTPFRAALAETYAWFLKHKVLEERASVRAAV